MTEKEYLRTQVVKVNTHINKIRRLRLIGLVLGLATFAGLILHSIEWYSQVQGDGSFTVPGYLALITAVLMLINFGFMLAVHFKLQNLTNDREIAVQAHQNHCDELRRAHSPLPYVPAGSNA